MNRYQKLCTLDIEHEYYTDLSCQDFSLTPTTATSKLLANYGMLFKRLPTGFAILYKVPEQGLPVFLESAKPFVLSFFMNLQNNKFINFTNLPFSTQRQLFYFSNLYKEQENGLMLHPNSSIDGSEVLSHEVKIRTSRFSIALKNSPEEGKLEIVDVNDQVIWQEQITENTRNSVNVHLTDLVTGWYRVLLDGDELEAFFYVESASPSPWGIINLHLGYPATDDTSPVSFRLEEVKLKDYKLRFEARETTWRYFLINKRNVSFSEPQILNGKSGSSFGEPQEVKLSNGTEALCIESKNAISIKEIPDHSFQLEIKKTRSKSSSSGIRVNIPLPVATADFIKPDTTDKDSEKIYSDMYVYL